MIPQRTDMKISKILHQSNMLIFAASLLMVSCDKADKTNSTIYLKGGGTENLKGDFYATEYGGLNYYVTNKADRDKLLSETDIDRIELNFNGKKYFAKPLIKRAYSRERNGSDFSFFIKPDSRQIVADTVNKMETILFISEKTDLEKMKKNGVIKFISLN